MCFCDLPDMYARSPRATGPRPDMYARSPRATGPRAEGIHIRQIPRAHVTTNTCTLFCFTVITSYIYIQLYKSSAYTTLHIFQYNVPPTSLSLQKQISWEPIPNISSSSQPAALKSVQCYIRYIHI